MYNRLHRGYLVQKTLQGCAANMGNKISLLVCEWPLIKCRSWYINGLIFQNFPNLKFKKIWEKIGQFCSKLDQLVWMDHFFLKNWYLYGSTFKFCYGTSLPKPNLSNPHPPPPVIGSAGSPIPAALSDLYLGLGHYSHFDCKNDMGIHFSLFDRQASCISCVWGV